MNLKEAFRYQNFLDKLFTQAINSISMREHCLSVTKVHHKSKYNPDAEDITETVDVDVFSKNDDVIKFIDWLVGEKYALTHAIGVAKYTQTPTDIDAEIEANKMRQKANEAVKFMLAFKARNSVEQGRDYKFNAEGNQTQYVYDIDVSSEEMYDRDAAKEFAKKMMSASDESSTLIDAARINTQVNYQPRFDVNESFDDIMAAFVSELQSEAK